jgi:hypothetical protein
MEAIRLQAAKPSTPTSEVLTDCGGHLTGARVVPGRGIRSAFVGNIDTVTLPPDDQPALLQDELDTLSGRERYRV